MKKKLIVSFSGGETSAYMAYLINKNKSYKKNFELKFVFANTGEENEETLIFIEKFSKQFKIPVVWVESVVHHGKRKSSTHKVVDFQSASRSGVDSSFEEVIKKYGIPNMATPHCTRELKSNPISSYAKSLGWKDYYTAIGIRIDEIDRVSVNWKKNRFIYPLVTDKPVTKGLIKLWWKYQPFRLILKDYQGNCKWCWKKSEKKLLKIAEENPEHFNFPQLMESKYGRYIPINRLNKLVEKGVDPTELFPITFFRRHKSSHQILESAGESLKSSKEMNPKIISITREFDTRDETEKCEPFAECEAA